MEVLFKTKVMFQRRTVSRALPTLISSIAALALLFSLSGCTLDLNYDKYAIVYGISDYPGTANDLTYTDDDARDFTDLLVAQGYQVILRITDYGPPAINEAYDAQLVADFIDVAQNADLDDLFLFYFSGHGAQDPASSGTTENTFDSDMYDEALVLVDDTLNSGVYLSDDELAALLRTIPCARKVVIIDACNSGGFIGNQLEVDAIPPSLLEGSSESYFERIADAINLYSSYGDITSDISPTDALVIAASGEREFSYEAPPPNYLPYSEYEHGVMTYFLLQSVSGGDYNKDGYVTVTETYHYIARNIKSEWNRPQSIFVNFLPHVSGGPIDYILFTK